MSRSSPSIWKDWSNRSDTRCWASPARTPKPFRLAKAKRPGLILADIQLADGSSGLDAVNELLKAFEVPVIFITAYPERFLTGERPEPAFLIAKPFQPATVSAIISQALFFERKAKRRAALSGRRPRNSASPHHHAQCRRAGSAGLPIALGCAAIAAASAGSARRSGSRCRLRSRGPASGRLHHLVLDPVARHRYRPASLLLRRCGRCRGQSFRNRSDSVRQNSRIMSGTMAAGIARVARRRLGQCAPIGPQDRAGVRPISAISRDVAESGHLLSFAPWSCPHGASGQASVKVASAGRSTLQLIN